ncbi:sulfite exporter TauE/SafE family protein [Mesoplasma photuris]|uniref:sulfite exporter TauE/SafE family protein n=1 Tax=Mesoplasma photuris TaxID=217731 RepID=UPI0004E19546|nr:sulfite exporter TauE/SafE family protein [Mesoplasma photuris]
MELSLLIPLLVLIAFSVTTLGSVSGVGGGVLFIPILLIILPTKNIDEIKFISIFLVFLGALINVLMEMYKKKLNYWILLIGIIISIPSIFLGQYLNSLFDQRITKIIIVCLLSIVNIVLIISHYWLKDIKLFKSKNSNSWYNIYLNDQKTINIFYVGAISFFGGLVTSLTGMGGGPLLMPLLLIFCNLQMKEAAPISHSLIAVSSLITLIFNFETFSNTQLMLENVLPMAMASIGGVFLGYWLKNKIKKEIYIKWLLILLMWASIIKMIIDLIQQ